MSLFGHILFYHTAKCVPNLIQLWRSVWLAGTSERSLVGDPVSPQSQPSVDKIVIICLLKFGYYLLWQLILSSQVKKYKFIQVGTSTIKLEVGKTKAKTGKTALVLVHAGAFVGEHWCTVFFCTLVCIGACELVHSLCL